jgi:hypothetical protein
MMNWINLDSEQQLDEIRERSASRPQVIFKHSTRCPTSSLDLINHRRVSNRISEDFQVGHESPQVLVIRNGKCIYDESHLGIDMDEILGNAGLN